MSIYRNKLTQLKQLKATLEQELKQAQSELQQMRDAKLKQIQQSQIHQILEEIDSVDFLIEKTTNLAMGAPNGFSDLLYEMDWSDRRNIPHLKHEFEFPDHRPN